MARAKSRLPNMWNGNVYPQVDEAEATGDDGMFKCPYCKTSKPYKEIVEVCQRGLFENHYHTLIVCVKCEQRMSLYSVVRGKQHVAIQG